MGGSLVDELGARLAEREAAGLLRRLALPHGLDFSSNDYLGFAREVEVLAPEATARPASRLLGGHTHAAERLEAAVAAWKGQEAALLFPSGYQANVSLLAALIGPDDRVISDAANHASLIDGIRLARPALKIVHAHLDVAAVARALAQPHPRGRTFLVTESLYSMDGDRAPLAEYAALAARSGAELIVDEAHASGLYGARGSGLVEALGLERVVTAVTSTFGKSLAASGAAVSGPRVVIQWLAQSARGFVYTTALSSVLVAQVEARLARLSREPRRGARALAGAHHLRARLTAAGLTPGGEDSPIVPLVLGTPARAVSVAEALSARGFDVRAVRPPTVPEGTSRLRLSVHADHDLDEVEALATALVECVR